MGIVGSKVYRSDLYVFVGDGEPDSYYCVVDGSHVSGDGCSAVQFALWFVHWYMPEYSEYEHLGGLGFVMEPQFSWWFASG